MVEQNDPVIFFFFYNAELLHIYFIKLQSVYFLKSWNSAHLMWRFSHDIHLMLLV
uniref:Uncharacterized protein n=1 Tax=Rhizophora mucronata TaxID=61149 RepID=A0A2P2N0T1_RHIMU